MSVRRREREFDINSYMKFYRYAIVNGLKKVRKWSKEKMTSEKRLKIKLDQKQNKIERKMILMVCWKDDEG